MATVKKINAIWQIRKKASWALRHYKRKNTYNGLYNAPLINKKGNLTPLSQHAEDWGVKPPRTRKQQKKIVKMGEQLLKIYNQYKNKNKNINKTEAIRRARKVEDKLKEIKMARRKKIKKKKISKRKWKGFIVTILLMSVLGIIRTFLPNYIPKELLWITDVVSGAISWLFIPLVYFIVTDLFGAKNIFQR